MQLAITYGSGCQPHLTDIKHGLIHVEHETVEGDLYRLSLFW